MKVPNGWTKQEVKYRDNIAEKLIERGYQKRVAFAIATSQVIKERGVKNG